LHSKNQFFKKLGVLLNALKDGMLTFWKEEMVIFKEKVHSSLYGVFEKDISTSHCDRNCILVGDTFNHLIQLHSLY
jgi:hypothetical protein